MSASESDQHFAVHNCIIPADLYYDTVSHIWIRRDAGKMFTLGLTDMAQTLAGKILYVTPKPVGTRRQANRPLAVYEAAKWLGVLRLPFSTTIAAHNPELQGEAHIVNQFPYTDGWIVKVETDIEIELSEHFATGEEAFTIYNGFLEQGQIEDCVHCVGFSN